jgi:membrane associated rhomboid family serine protease
MPQNRYRYTSSSYLDYFPTGVKWLLIINTAVFLVCYIGGMGLQRHVSVLLGLSPETAVRNFMVWQVFTYMFVHFGTFHWLFNMLGLWFFGMPIEQVWGMRRFLKFYFLCGVAAGVCVLVANILFAGWGVTTIGASGAIFGVLVGFAVLFPDALIPLFIIFFPIKAKYAVSIFVALELLATFGPNTGVSTVAHLGGAAFAYLYLKQRIPAINMPDFRGQYRQWKMQRAKKKFQVYMRKHGPGGPTIH